MIATTIKLSFLVLSVSGKELVNCPFRKSKDLVKDHLFINLFRIDQMSQRLVSIIYRPRTHLHTSILLIFLL